MQVDVILYGAARVVIGQPLVAVPFSSPTTTLNEVLQHLVATYPRARPYLLDGAGELPAFMRVLINNARPDPDATLATVLHDKDRVALLVAVAGGSENRLTLFYSPHMTSIDNEAGRASGYANAPLSPAGREQARELGQHYAQEKLGAVFHSDLQRASATVHIAFAGRNLPLVPDARLREYDYGDMTQYPVAMVEEEFARRITEPFPRGESLLMVVQRVGAFLRDVSQRYDGKTIAVIGHRATRYALDYWCGNASLEEIVNTPWQWREIPIWRYELNARNLERRSIG
ncbi:MAG TPA: histidine phosphatase family protein [Ktedonobacteraceae bacterium]|nr:histidine phosphatase family protein [Ktedonobacteraceae bacterium]